MQCSNPIWRGNIRVVSCQAVLSWPTRKRNKVGMGGAVVSRPFYWCSAGPNGLDQLHRTGQHQGHCRPLHSETQNHRHVPGGKDTLLRFASSALGQLGWKTCKHVTLSAQPPSPATRVNHPGRVNGKCGGAGTRTLPCGAPLVCNR